jgi:GNAT superfamily N-acetyltransferase
MDFKTELFCAKDIDQLFDFITDTIKVSYVGYYPQEAIDYFIRYSNKQGILVDTDSAYVIVIKDNDKIIGTGTLKGTHIKRVFVNPAYQGKGLGRLIMNDLEIKAKNNNLKLVELHSSLFAISFYNKLGFKMFRIGKVEVENGELLYYQRMSKSLLMKSLDTLYDFHDKLFKVVQNDGMDAEVNTDTTFHFFQHKELVFAEYKGGKVKKGEIFGIIENSTIRFYYHQENLSGERNQGSSFDEIIFLEDCRIQLIDRWEWKTKPGEGLCILEEV